MIKKQEILVYESAELEGFKVDIIDKGDMFDAWIYYKNYGIKSYMFGWPKEQHDGTWTLEGFINLVEMNLYEDAIHYAEEYMDYDDMMKLFGEE